MTSSYQYQREADAARVGLADTLGQLREGVAPSALSGEVIALVKDSGLSIVKTLADQARTNPVPALLIGAGLTMLLTRTTGGDVMGVANTALRSAASTGAGAARSAASGVASAASGMASGVAAGVGSAASGVASGVSSAASGLASGVSSAASGVSAAATGAAYAASGLASNAAGAVKDAVAGASERASGAASTVTDAAGNVRDRVAGSVDQARASAADTYASAKDRVQSTLEAGRRELHDRQDQAGVLAGEAEQKARTMIEDARHSISKLLEEQPILMAALGAALGAAIGALLPVSKAEKEFMGPAGAKAIGAGREALASAADVVRQEAASADIGGKVGALADKVVQGVTKQA